jgi:hypothetical protein
VRREDREAAVEALFEGIMAAYNATAYENNDPFSDFQTYAHAALASLEAAGFKVERKS